MDRRDSMNGRDSFFKRVDARRMVAVVELCRTDDELWDDGEGRPIVAGELRDDEALEADGECILLEVPIRYEVCGTCDGKGTHVNPSIDAHGITAEEWSNDWDDEEREGYFAGNYDVQCYECHGARVVPEVDEDKCAKPIIERIEEHRRQEALYACERANEQRMGY